MTRLFTTTALVAVMASPVLAESDTMSGDVAEKLRMRMNEAMDSMKIDASELIDSRVYMKAGASSDHKNMSDDDTNQSADAGDSSDEMMDEDHNMSAGIADVPENWEMVGEIEDVILTAEGDVNSLVVDAGGFLGMNETSKKVDLANVNFVKDKDDEGEFFVVYTGAHGKFEESSDYEQSWADENNMQSTRNSEEMGYNEPERQQVEYTDLTTEELLGAAAYGSNDNWVGEISELAVTEDGQVEAVIVDVGGFLGIGEKPVALNMDQVDLSRVDGDDLRAYLAVSETELENMESYQDEM